METPKKKMKVNPYLVGGVIAIGGALWLLSEPTEEEKASGLEGLGSLKSRLRKIKERITPKFVQKIVQKLPAPPVPKMIQKATPILTVGRNTADYYGELYNHK
jgi:hypothetical protein